MRLYKSRIVVLVMGILLGCSSFAALDITIVNTSNRIAQALVNGFECDQSETCYISPNTSVRIPHESMASFCKDSEEECIVELKVADLRSPIGSAAYRFEDGILYVNGVKWRGYSARMLANDVIEIYQDSEFSDKF